MLKRDKPKSPLLQRVDPETGKVVSESGFVGTARTSNEKNRFVKPKGYAAVDDIREDWEMESDGEKRERMDGSACCGGKWRRRHQ